MVILLMILFFAVMYGIGQSTHNATVTQTNAARSEAAATGWSACGALALIVLAVVILFGAAGMAALTGGMQ